MSLLQELMEDMNFLSRVEYLHPYHPVNIYVDGDKIENPAFDQPSRNVLNLKSQVQVQITNYTQMLIDRFLNEYSGSDVVVCYVPSSDHTKLITGMSLLVQNLVQNNKFIDGRSCVRRSKTIQKLATGGARDISIHMNSIQVFHPEIIAGKMVLLLDDIVTSGNSLKACKKKLKAAGAADVRCIALAKTER